MKRLPFRQVHLDFHTSGLIEGIGEDFDKKEFQRALKNGRVESITLFSKCHHGWSYHPSKANRIHPHLNFDLLGQQLEACNELGVRAPVYISAGIDEKEAVAHPEWLLRNADESTEWVPDFTGAPGFHILCFNTSYMPVLLAQIHEVMELYHPEEIFLDIASVKPCLCAACRAEMLALGDDPRDTDAVTHQAERVFTRYAQSVREAVRAHSENCAIFHNGGHITRGRRDLAAWDSHFELESLPTGGWGYNHFPMSAAYVAGLGKEYLGMTGKFHTTWGEFGGFKHPNALRYETGLSLAFGAKCSIGDQLHPRGAMNPDTYALIGAAYAEVEEKEPYCEDAELLYDVGILGQEAVSGGASDRDMSFDGDTGANRIMLEGGYLYRFLDLESDFAACKLIILPDTIRMTEELASRLRDYMAAGGELLATGKSGMAIDSDMFLLPLGAKAAGQAQSIPSYLLPGFALTTGNSPHVMYEPCEIIEPAGGKVFARCADSYFNRDTYRFCSHLHTPNKPGNGRPAACFTSNAAYIGWQVFTDYAKKGSLHCKELVIYAVDSLLAGSKTATASLPDRGVFTVTRQASKNRYVMHLLFAHTTLRGAFRYTGQEKLVEVIEDIVPLYDTRLQLRTDKYVRRVYLAPQIEELGFAVKDGLCTFTVPRWKCHQMIVVEL